MKKYQERQYMTRKLARKMAKAQMKADGVQHPCRQVRLTGRVVLGNASLGPHTSFFAANWRGYAAKRMKALGKQKTRRRVA